MSGKIKSRSSGPQSAQITGPKNSQSRLTSAATFREDSPPCHGNGNGSHNKLRFIDLFCGIGGFRLAFEKAGCQCVFSSDWNKYAQQTYAANFGERPHGDIHSVAVADIPAHDILCAGFGLAWLVVITATPPCGEVSGCLGTFCHFSAKIGKKRGIVAKRPLVDVIIGLVDGIWELADGKKRRTDAIRQLSVVKSQPHEAINQLADGVWQLADGKNQPPEAVRQLAAGVRHVAEPI